MEQGGRDTKAQPRGQVTHTPHNSVCQGLCSDFEGGHLGLEKTQRQWWGGRSDLTSEMPWEHPREGLSLLVTPSRPRYIPSSAFQQERAELGLEVCRQPRIWQGPSAIVLFPWNLFWQLLSFMARVLLFFCQRSYW